MTTINLFNLSKAWFDMTFENHDLKPTHTAFIFYAIDLNNRLSWVDNFGLPAYQSCNVLNISYNTFRKVLYDLINLGYIKLIEKSTNQYTANIISLIPLYQILSKQSKSKYKATVKALTKQVQKHCIINKPIKPINKETSKRVDFDLFWNLYNKKVDRKKTEPKWNKLPFTTQQLILEKLPGYIESTPEKKYRKNPATYLNNESWNNDIDNNIVKSVIEQYNEILKTTQNISYKTLISIKYDILIRFDTVVTEKEFGMLKLNGQAGKGFYIEFLEYGKTKKDFLNNLYRHAKKY